MSRPRFRGQWPTRLALLLLHITIVVAAISLTPDGYYFQLGGYKVPHWSLSGYSLVALLSAKTGRAITTLRAHSARATFMALVALHLGLKTEL